MRAINPSSGSKSSASEGAAKKGMLVLHQNRDRLSTLSPLKDVRRAILVLFATGLLGSLSACSCDGVAEPEIFSFTTSKSEFVEGESTVLEWRTSNAVSVRLADASGDEIDLADAGIAEGSVEITISESTSFVLTAFGEEGTHPAEATVSVTVLPPEAPLIVSFGAEPEEIVEGESSLLSWEIQRATSVSVADDQGVIIHSGQEMVEQGSVAVQPERDIVYTLTAAGDGGSVEADVTVSVSSVARIIAFDVDDQGPVLPGTEVMLSWEVREATSVILLEGEDVLVQSSELEGSFAVEVELSTTFTLRVEGTGVTRESKIEVLVLPFIEYFRPSPSEVRAGDEVVLAWRLRGAKAASILGPSSFAVEIGSNVLAEGELVTAASTTGAFVLTAVSDGLEQTMSSMVTIVERPLIREFTASPEVLTEGGYATLAWSIDGDGEIELVAEPGGSIFLAEADLAAGRTTVSPSTSTLYTLRAVNANGVDEAGAIVTVFPVPEITAFSASPRRVSAGDETRIAWSTVDAVQIRLLRDGVDLQVDPGASTGSHVDTVFVSSTYTLIAENMVGGLVQAEVEVSVGPPVVLSLDAQPLAAHPGNTVRFTWETTGGGLLYLRDPENQVICETTVVEETVEGACVHTAVMGGIYLLTVENAEGADSATVDIFVTEGPIIRSFRASPNLANIGDGVLLSWVVDGHMDPAVAHMLSLSDELGNHYDLEGFDVFSDTLMIVLDEPGAHTFTLTATSDDAIHAASVEVDVVAEPRIVSFHADPERLITDGGTLQPISTLSWETEDAVELVLWEISYDGVPVFPLLLETTDPAIVSSGSIQVSPSENAIYRLVALNALGGTVTADVLILVDLPTIESFTIARKPDGAPAGHADIALGDEVTLSWDSPTADHVIISPLPPAVTEYPPGTTPPTGGYIDLSLRPEAVRVPLELGSVGRAHADFFFPEGFIFPYYGLRYTAARATSSGYLTFDLSSAVSTSPNEIPHPGTGTNGVPAMLAPFFDRLDARNGPSEIWYELLEEDGEKVIAVQWKGWNFNATARHQADLNFMIKLRRSGVVEFHYGPMDNDTSDRQHFSDGSSASIGLQDHSQRHGYRWRHRQAMPGGLTGWSVIFDFRLPATGSLDYSLSSSFPIVRTKDFVLTAINDSGYEMDYVAATRWRDLTDESAWFASSFTIPTQSPQPGEYEVGDPAGIDWLVNDARATHVTESEQPLAGCESSGDFFSTGSCSTVLDEERTWQFRLHASNPISSGSRPIEIEVMSVLRLHDFSVSQTHIDGGDSVTLSWLTEGATSVRIEVDELGGASSSINIDPNDFDQGQRLITPSRTARYTLEVEDAGTGRVRTGSLWVYVDPARVLDASATTTQVGSGEATDLIWEVENADRVWIQPANPEWGGGDFVDIRNIHGANQITQWSGNHTTWVDERSAFVGGGMTGDFQFPFGGQNRTSFTVTVKGYLTFHHSAKVEGTPREVLPSAPSGGIQAGPESVIAPFWTNLALRDTGQVHVLRVPAQDDVPDHLIFQWSAMQMEQSTINRSASFTFQAVLFADGNAEFRYGSMAHEDMERAAGKHATIGWQGFSMDGGMLDKGLTQPVPGGLQGRSLKVPCGPMDSGWTVHPEVTTEYTVCAEGGGWIECRTVVVLVVEPGYVMFSEVMIDAPAIGDGMGEWFEVRNASAYDIDIAGWTLQSGGEAFSLPDDQPIVLPAGAFLVMARGGSTVNGGLEADVVYGAAAPDLRLDPVAGELVMFFGDLVVDSVAWNTASGWTITPNKSLSVDGSYLRGLSTDNDMPSAWCTALESYGDGLYGSPGYLGRGCRHHLYDVDPAGADWIEIRETGQVIDGVATTAWGGVRMVPGGIGFQMPFFAGTYTDVWVSIAGWLSFNSMDDTARSPNNGTRSIPSQTSPTNIVAPFWGTLRADPEDAAVYFDLRTIDGLQVAIVQWTKLHYSNTHPGELTFQVQLWENGDIASVVHTARSFQNRHSVGPEYYDGTTTALLGIQNDGGTDGIQYSNNEPVVGRQTRILYRRSPRP